MTNIDELYNVLSSASQDWLEDSLTLLDQSIAEFGVQLYKASVGRAGIDLLEARIIADLICEHDFCGLTAKDVYNIVAHDEGILKWSHLDQFNKEKGQGGDTTRTALASLMQSAPGTPSHRSEEMIALFKDDTGVDFVTCTSPLDRKQPCACVGLSANILDPFDRGPYLNDMLNTDLWVGLCVDIWVDTPDDWKPTRPKYNVSGYEVANILEDGRIELAYTSGSRFLTSDEAIIYVPVKKLKAISHTELRTLLPEHILDKYGLPKARY